GEERGLRRDRRGAPEGAGQLGDSFDEGFGCGGQLATGPGFGEVPVGVHEPLEESEPLLDGTDEVALRDELLVGALPEQAEVPDGVAQRVRLPASRSAQV